MATAPGAREEMASASGPAGIRWPEHLELAPGVAFHRDRFPGGCTPLTESRLVVLFGPTGVGKSTTLRAVRKAGHPWRELPDRRTLTSHLVVGPQREDPADETLPRLERYRFVRTFREEHPGGMVALLTRLALRAPADSGPLVFDGLRGVAEAEAAVGALPRARFLVLHCPDAIRLSRLLERDDPHDRAVAREPSGSGLSDLIPSTLEEVLAPGERREIEQRVRSGRVDEREMRTKLRILVEERRTHDPDGTRELLTGRCPERTLVVDTSSEGRHEAARRVATWLADYGGEAP